MWPISLIVCVLLVPFGVFFWNATKKIEMASENSQFDRRTYSKRMAWLLGYFLVGILLLGIVCAWNMRSAETTSDGPGRRFLWCLGSNVLGAFLYGFKYRVRSKAVPFVMYALPYPLIIVALSALTLAVNLIIVRVAAVDDESVFYCLAFFTGIFFGQFIDNLSRVPLIGGFPGGPKSD